MAKFEESETQIIAEIAKHQVDPNPVQRVIEFIGEPFAVMLRGMSHLPVVKKVPELVHYGVDKGLRATVAMSKVTYSENGVYAEYDKKGMRVAGMRDIANLPLKDRDLIADRFDTSNALIIGAEGAVAGAATTLCEGVPFAQFLIPSIITLDIGASLTILSRHASQIAVAYGYPPSEQANIAHVLASMVAYTDHSDEEGFFATKAGVFSEIRLTTQFLAQHAGMSMEDMLSKAEAPALLRLIQKVATRLGMTVTEKELAMLVPVAGGGLNATMNVAFQQTGHTAAKDYFRRIVLIDKYGVDPVWDAIRNAIDDYKFSKTRAA